MRISGIILALAAAVLLSAPSAHGQKRQKDSLDESLVFTDEYLDTVNVRGNVQINDYVMLGVNYGATFSRMSFNPPKTQGWRFTKDYYSVMLTKYGKMFGYMPYFGLTLGAAHGYEGFMTAINKETGSSSYIEVKIPDYPTNIPVTEVQYEVVEGMLLASFHYDMEHVKLLADAGIYGGYRLDVQRVTPWASRPEGLEDSFFDYENRFDYGLQGGAGVAFVLDPVELRLGAMVRYSWSSIYQADYNSDVYYRFAYPFDVIPTVGVYVHIGKRRGKTTAMLRKEAHDIVYGEN